jgi:uncharacterized protein YjiS (DUF1127 family)
MTTIDHSSAHLPVAARPAIVTRVANVILAQLRIWKNRRAIYKLGNLTNSELADIGLTRADLHVATGLPLGVDPTTHLGHVVRERTRRLDRVTRLPIY